jgi:hypothetical protein
VEWLQQVSANCVVLPSLHHHAHAAAELCASASQTKNCQRRARHNAGTNDYPTERCVVHFFKQVCGTLLTSVAAFAAITAVFERHGACTIETPVFELKETLTGKCVPPPVLIL